MAITMTVAEREAYLCGLHVGILSAGQANRGPLAVPVWYSYQPGGEVSVLTSKLSRKAQCMRESGRFGLCAQTEVPMYQYVSVEGPITTRETRTDPDERRAMAHRYLGEEIGDLFLEATAAEIENDVTFRMTPEFWMTADFNKPMV